MDVDALWSWQAKMMKLYGYYVHFVFDSTECPYGINIHTHGFDKTYGCKDFQICMPIDAETADGIFRGIVDRIKSGVNIVSGMELEGIINDFRVKIVGAKEGPREVFRIIMPDPVGRLEYGEMVLEYNDQYRGTDALQE